MPGHGIGAGNTAEDRASPCSHRAHPPNGETSREISSVSEFREEKTQDESGWSGRRRALF